MTRKHLLFVSLSIILLELNAQTSVSPNSIISNWLTFETKSTFAPQQILQEVKTIYQLDEDNKFDLLKTSTDKQGTIHAKYQQYYKNILMEGAEFIIHHSANKQTTGNGKLVSALDLDTNASVSENIALSTALSTIDATKYTWEDDNFKSVSQKLPFPKTFLSKPQGELVLVAHQTSQIADHYRLAYKFDICATIPFSRNDVYVDAHTGKWIKNISSVCTNHHHSEDAMWSPTTCTGEAAYLNNDVTFDCEETDGIYSLEDLTRGNGIITYNAANSTFLPTDTIRNTSSHWTNDSDAIAVHWGTQQVYDYFNEVHNQNSFNNNGAKISSWVHHNMNWNNAAWYGNVLVYGDGDGQQFNALTALDIIAHEFTHGITEYSADLVYSGESGALNESFSDIFATVIEHTKHPDGANWNIGDAVIVAPWIEGIRSMSEPSSSNVLTQQPDTYLGDYWYYGDGDHGGVHINSGVLNYWFYLLCEGGSGVNDDGLVYDVEAIGMTKAAEIAFSTLTHYLTSTSTYENVDSAFLAATQALYGVNSIEYASVVAAGCAVGLREGNDCIGDFFVIDIIEPIHNEQLIGGEHYRIEWETTPNIQNVELEYSIDNGQTWIDIITTTGNPGFYLWHIPEITENNVKIKISSLSEPFVNAISDCFEIQACNDLMASFMMNTASACEGEQVILTSTSIGTNILDFEWYRDGELIGTGPEISTQFYNIPATGGSDIQLVITNPVDCQSSHEQFLRLIPMSDASFNVNTNGLTASFFSNTLQTATFNWDFGDGSSSTEQNPQHTYNEASIYNVCLTIHDECSSADYCSELTVNTSTQPNILFQSEFWDYTLADNYQIQHIRSLQNGEYQVFFNNNFGSYLLQIDKYGNAETARSYPISTIQSFIQTDGIHFTAHHKTIKKYNHTGFEYWSKVTNLDNDIYDIAGQNNGDIGVALGTAGISKLNTNGIQIWSKQLNTNGVYGNFDWNKVFQCENNWIFTGTTLNSSDGLYYPISLKLDTNGHLLWNKVYEIEDYQIVNVIAETDNTIYLSAVNSNLHQTVLLKMDDIGQIVWSKQFDNVLLTDAKIINETLFFTGTEGTESTRNILMKMALQSGNIIWSKTYGENITSLNALESTLDNEIIIVANGNRLNLIKTDFDGIANNCILQTSIPLTTSNTTILTTDLSNLVFSSLSLFFSDSHYSLNIEESSIFSTNICSNLSCTVVSAFTSQTICKDIQTTFFNQSQGADIFQWKINGLEVATTEHLSHSFPEIGSYTVSLTAGNVDDACYRTFSKIITVHSTLSSLNSPNTIFVSCSNQGDTILYAEIEGMQSYKWYYGGDLIGFNANLTVEESGVYTLIVRDYCGTTLSTEIEVILNEGECVYPGDLNNDGIVNQHDFLLLGVAYESTGPTRPEVNLTWQGQPAYNWDASTLEGINFKHLDADGNGTINALDSLAIKTNYGETHDDYVPVDAPPISLYNLIPEVVAVTTLPNNQQCLQIDVTLENTLDNELPLLYGIAGTVKVDALTDMNITGLLIDYSQSILSSDQATLLPFSKIGTNNKIDFALTRINYDNISGEGTIASFFVVADDILPTVDSILLSVEKPVISFNSGTIMPLVEGDFTIVVEEPTPNEGSISGSIETPLGILMNGVAVELKENVVVVNNQSTVNGNYGFSSLNIGSDYSLQPSKNTNHANGISVHDLVLTKAHILQTNPFDSPYKIIAADVNNSESVSIADIILMKELLQGNSVEFTAVNSWRFIPKDYVFPDPTNPFPFPEEIQMNNLQGVQNEQNFIGVKMGDVNDSADSN